MTVKNEKSHDSWNGRSLYIILFAVFFAGVLAGSLSLKYIDGEGLIKLTGLADGFLEKRAVSPFLETFLSSFKSALLPLGVCALMGFCAIGQPIALAALFFRGAGFGTSISYLYCSYGFQGLVITALLILPPAAVGTAALMMSARESIRLSAVFFSFCFSGKETRQPDFRLYLLKFAVLLVIILISAFSDGILSLLLAGAVIPD